MTLIIVGTCYLTNGRVEGLIKRIYQKQIKPRTSRNVPALSRRIKQFIIEFYRKFAAMALNAE